MPARVSSFTIGVWVMLGLFADAGTAEAGTPRDGEPCTEHAECDDNNPCTDVSCLPDETCANIPLYDLASECCNPTTGQLMLIDCGGPEMCYESTCYPMGCTCCDLPDGDPCAAPQVPTVSEWGVVIMTAVVLTAGTVVLRKSRGAASI